MRIRGASISKLDPTYAQKKTIFANPCNTYSLNRIQVRHYPGQDLFEVTYRVFNSESGEQDDNGHCNVNFRVRNSSSLPLSFKGGRSDISYRGPLQVTTRGIATSLLQKMKTDQGDEYEMLSSIPQTVKGVLSALFEHVRTIPGLDNDPEVDYGSDANWEVQDFDDKTRYSIKGALFDQSGTEVKPGVIVRFDLLKKKNGD